MKVSFDFDHTLSRIDVQEFAKELTSKGYEVWIVTSRFDDETATSQKWIKSKNKRLFDIAEECGIRKDNIHFTCMQSKSYFLENKDFVFHLDDDDIELTDILESNKFSSSNCFPVNVNHFEWEKICRNILNKNLLK